VLLGWIKDYNKTLYSWTIGSVWMMRIIVKSLVGGGVMKTAVSCWETPVVGCCVGCLEMNSGLGPEAALGNFQCLSETGG
jgi:hypothetical protein